MTSEATIERSKSEPLEQVEAATRGETDRQMQQKQSPVSRVSLVATISSTLLIRVASRTSFVVLGFYLGAHFASAAFVALILEAFYITELLLAPLIGSFSDRLGRKPFLVLAPIVAGVAALCLMLAAKLFPSPQVLSNGPELWLLLILLLLGRLLEGAATGLNAPATLGYIADVTARSEKLRARVMTAFEIVTVGGLALAIPFGGKVSSALGTWGFLVVIALYMTTLLLILFGVKEQRQEHELQRSHVSLLDSLTVIRHKRIFTFLPAWFCVNALVGAWTTLIIIMLAYPESSANLRHPHQLLYGGFSQMGASLAVGLFALFFLLGMGGWIPLLSRIRRTTVMLIGLSGLALSIVCLIVINGLADNPTSLAQGSMPIAIILLVPTMLGIVLLSGFTPVALTQMAAIAETLPGQRGAVMGLYSVVMAVGQLLGSILGGFCVDWNGFYGLMFFSVVMGVASLSSVLYVRSHGHDLLGFEKAH